MSVTCHKKCWIWHEIRLWMEKHFLTNLMVNYRFHIFSHFTNKTRKCKNYKHNQYFILSYSYFFNFRKHKHRWQQFIKRLKLLFISHKGIWKEWEHKERQDIFYFLLSNQHTLVFDLITRYAPSQCVSKGL